MMTHALNIFLRNWRKLCKFLSQTLVRLNLIFEWSNVWNGLEVGESE